MPKARKSKMFDSPFLVGVSAVLVLLALNAAVFNVPLIPLSTANGQSIELNAGAAGIPLIAMLALIVLFMRRMKK